MEIEKILHDVEQVNKKCRICLQFSKEMNNIFTMQFPRNSLNVIVFLRQITGLEVKFW